MISSMSSLTFSILPERLTFELLLFELRLCKIKVRLVGSHCPTQLEALCCHLVVSLLPLSSGTAFETCACSHPGNTGLISSSWPVAGHHRLSAIPIELRKFRVQASSPAEPRFQAIRPVKALWCVSRNSPDHTPFGPSTLQFRNTITEHLPCLSTPSWRLFLSFMMFQSPQSLPCTHSQFMPSLYLFCIHRVSEALQLSLSRGFLSNFPRSLALR
jgi:hypothetical protein